MRRLIAPLSFIGLVSLAPLASAMTAPLSEEQLTEAADLIAHGHISDVLCQGEPVYDGQSTTTAYHAILSIGEVFKPEDSDLTSVTMPFATVVWDEDQPPAMCGWTPSYLPEERGTYYLTTGVDTGLYTLVSWNAFVPEASSVPGELPSCEEPEPEPDTTASEDVSESAEDVEVGPVEDAGGMFPQDAFPQMECVDDDDCDSGSGVCQDGECWYPPGGSLICSEDSDCADGEECVWITSGNSECVSMDADECEADSECGNCGTCSAGQCIHAPHCPDCFSDSDCAEGQECYWTNNESDAYCRDIESSSGSSDGGDSGGSSGCASGGSQAPLTLALLVLGLVALTGRRRVLG